MTHGAYNVKLIWYSILHECVNDAYMKPDESSTENNVLFLTEKFSNQYTIYA
jgi:hypothetical protein